MYRSFYENLTFAWLPAATTIFFVTVFALALVKLFILSAKKDFDLVSALPLDGQDPLRVAELQAESACSAAGAGNPLRETRSQKPLRVAELQAESACSAAGAGNPLRETRSQKQEDIS